MQHQPRQKGRCMQDQQLILAILILLKRWGRRQWRLISHTPGLIILQISLGLASTKQQLLKAPNVRVKKKSRETIPEVVVPDKVVDEGKKFVEKSFYRKAAHVQEFEIGIQYMPNPICNDVYAHPLKAETLKSVGIEPQQLWCIFLYLFVDLGTCFQSFLRTFFSSLSYQSSRRNFCTHCKFHPS